MPASNHNPRTTSQSTFPPDTITPTAPLGSTRIFIRSKQEPPRLANLRQRTLAETLYSFHTRFDHGKGTNPEELLAAAHAGCVTMALSLVLQQAGLKADSLETSCVITLDQKDGGFAITESRLELKARIPGATAEAFQAAAQAAKTNCPVSKIYSTTITLDAKLES